MQQIFRIFSLVVQIHLTEHFLYIFVISITVCNRLAGKVAFFKMLSMTDTIFYIFHFFRKIQYNQEDACFFELILTDLVENAIAYENLVS